jgi:hypothetical protein
MLPRPCLVLLLCVHGSTAAEPPGRPNLRGDPLPAGALARLEPAGADRDGLSVAAIAFAAKGEILYTVDRKGSIHHWQAATGRHLRALEAAGGIDCRAVFSADGTRLAVVDAGKKVRVRNAATGTKISAIPTSQGVCVGLALSPDGKTVAVPRGPNSATWYTAWEADTGRSFHESGEPDVPCSDTLAFAPDGRSLALGDLFGTVHVFRLADGKRRRVLDLSSGRGPEVCALTFSPDGRFLAGGFADRSVAVWEIASGKELSWPAHLPAEREGGRVVAFSPDGRSLATAGSDRRVYLHDVVTGREHATFAGHRAPVFALAFSPDGKLLASVGRDDTAFLWAVPPCTAPEKEDLPAETLAGLWADLASADVRRAYRAVEKLRAAGDRAADFLGERLRGVGPTLRQLQRLVDELDSDEFAVREKASAQLRGFGEEARELLEEARAKPASREVQRRAEQLLLQLDTSTEPVPPPDRLQQMRAVLVLEQAGTLAARRVLAGLARDSVEVHLAREARAALRRLERSPFTSEKDRP